ncbi:hypothetical protein GWK08_08945 [Leptobacterium flavescens]|uniref:Uncharacterized protein n=1 Tax=Leptobacterium flavescens TaxID=472055 RepID=A0A6P0UJK9_9FLAO|nr:hypothetical protein [Leptobacterium flavescens]NER13561.1 hypothetical protein [Leptobacterium flavescens]
MNTTLSKPKLSPREKFFLGTKFVVKSEEAKLLYSTYYDSDYRMIYDNGIVKAAVTEITKESFKAYGYILGRRFDYQIKFSELKFIDDDWNT